MTLSRKLEDYLRRQGVRYVEQASHPGGRGLAKVVTLRDGKGGWLIAVLPAPLHVDLKALALASGKRGLRLASERDMARRFGPDLPTPFVDLAGVPVYVDHGFGDWSHIYFETEDHAGVVGLRLRDYVRVARPGVGRFSRSA
jgi:prolyl-tRNA editing enzyme YbaK/EbsC (Cys-tRNA(Pro) deacylase)